MYSNAVFPNNLLFQILIKSAFKKEKKISIEAKILTNFCMLKTAFEIHALFV